MDAGSRASRAREIRSHHDDQDGDDDDEDVDRSAREVRRRSLPYLLPPYFVLSRAASVILMTLTLASASLSHLFPPVIYSSTV